MAWLTTLDYGMDGLSAPMHKWRKIWFMHPPTEKNLSLMATEDGQVAKMTRLAQSLEGGVMFVHHQAMHSTYPLAVYMQRLRSPVASM